MRIAGLAALAAVLLLATVLATRPDFDPGPFVTVALPDGTALTVGRYEVTEAQWSACFDAGACPDLRRRAGNAAFPVTGVNYFDVMAYLGWINSRSTARYRLPTAGEWAAFSGGLSRRPKAKLFDDPRLAWAADYGTEEQVSPRLRPSGAWGTAANGLSDLGGNVWEWTADCVTATEPGRICPAAIAAGLHEAEISVFIRDPASGGCSAGTPPANLGFRLVRED